MNFNKIPSTRWFVSVKQAIYEVGITNGIPQEQIDKTISELQSLELNDEVWLEKIKTSEHYKEILKKTATLIKQKNEFDKKKEEQEIERKRKESERKVTLSSGILKIDNFVDNIKLFHNLRPFFYDRNQLFWFWNKELYKWEMVDETDIMIQIEAALEKSAFTLREP